MEKKIIVHPGCIVDDLASNDMFPRFPQNVLDNAKNALDEINVTVANARKPTVVSYAHKNIPQEADVYILTEDNARLLANCVLPGDSVTILGAYTELCVEHARMVVSEITAEVKISTRGTFTY